MADSADVVIIGAGPYGLSVAAYLSAAGVSYRHFGIPMSLWRTSMPRGMYLKSQGFASNLSDPGGKLTLEAFCAATGRWAYQSYGSPIPIEVFTEYGLWFAEKLGLPVEESMVTSVTRDGGGFSVTVSDGERIAARAVVCAVGVEHFTHFPEPFASLPRELCTHACAHTDLGAFKGRRVVVAGSGQSALESAALLHEAGADVQVLARRPKLSWNGEPLPPGRPLPQRLREPESGLGSGWATWFYSTQPDLFRRLPPATRLYRARTALGPAGANWLRPRVAGKFPVHCGHTVTAAAAEGGQVRLTASCGGSSKELVADHVIAATGYRPDLTRLGFFGTDIAAPLRTLGTSVRVGRGYESDVPGLYFVGPMVAPSFGPVMRFVFGTWHAAPAVARRLAESGIGTARALAASR